MRPVRLPVRLSVRLPVSSLNTPFYATRHHTTKTQSSSEEICHFNELAKSWWDIDGPQRILHKMNIARLDFIRETLLKQAPQEDVYVPGFSTKVFPQMIEEAIKDDIQHCQESHLDSQQLTVLDVGCGGGILAESMARLPYVKSVKGIDLSPEVLRVAKEHNTLDKLSYELMSVDKVAEQYDVVTMFEMLEHVDYPKEVLDEAVKKLKPNGTLFISTINRDFISWFTTIFMGEKVLRIVPEGTHTLEKYINVSEIEEYFKDKPFEILDTRGCAYLPFKGWFFTDKADVGNYFMAVRKK